MSHWAEINSDNKVLRVTVGNNADVNEGYNWLVENLGGTWIQTSYNGNIRGTYAGIGYTYLEAEDIFITPQPFPSWVRTGSFWNAPIAMPTNGARYSWDEEAGQWNEA